MKIFVKDPVLTDLKSFFEKCFTFPIGKYSYKFVKTYLDATCTEQESMPARRSFDDLLLIARTYFPDVSETEVIKTLSSIDRMRCFVCTDINKPVFYIRSYLDNCDTFSAMGTHLTGKSAYSIDKLKELLKQ